MRRAMSTCAGALAALSLLFCTPAFASRTPHLPSAPLEGHLHRGFTTYSTNWSGYAAYEATFTSAEGDWVQPEAHCASVSKHGYALAAFWVGLDGYEDNTVEQTGTEADCAGPTPVYRAWWELYPKASVLISMTVKAGDRMHAQVTNDELTLEDLTTKAKFKEGFLPGSLAFASAEWIAEAPAKNAVTDFGEVKFSFASASSEALSGGPIESPSAWNDEAIALVSGSPRHLTELAVPGALEDNASAFTITQGTASAPHGHSNH